MKWICSLLIGSLMGLGGLQAQTSDTAATKTQGTQGTSASNQELNIEAYVELLRSQVRKSKSQIIGEVMQFDSTQAATFWPIYKQFEADYTKIGDRIVTLVKNYTEHYDQMTDAVADQLANQLLSIEQQRNDLKKQYYQKFKQALDAITAARFLLVENQLEKITDLQIASQLPVIRGGEAQ
jgi:hypothetical protein